MLISEISGKLNVPADYRSYSLVFFFSLSLLRRDLIRSVRFETVPTDPTGI